MSLVFFDAKDKIRQELETTTNTFSPGLSRSMWLLSDDITNNILTGMIQSKNIIGVFIEDNKGNHAGSAGFTPYEEFPGAENFIKHTVPLYFQAQQNRYVGSVTVFSSRKEVFNNIKNVILLILINATIKTIALWIIFILISQNMLSKPLLLLANTMKKIKFNQPKDLEVSLKIKKHNELTFLEAGFNKMIKHAIKASSDLKKSNDRLTTLIKGLERLSLAKTKFIATALTAQNICSLLYSCRITKLQFGFSESTETKPNHITEFTFYHQDNDVILSDLVDIDSYYVSQQPLSDQIEQLKNNISTFIEDNNTITLLPRNEAGLTGFVTMEGELVESLTNEDKHYLTTLVKSLSNKMDNIANTQTLEQEVNNRTRKLKNTLEQLEEEHEKLKNTQSRLIHAEKMASLGVLVAGVAHEINNPTNFVHVGTQNLLHELNEFKQFIFQLAGDNLSSDMQDTFNRKFEEFFKQINSIKNGSSRIKELVSELQHFSSFDIKSKQSIDIIKELTSTLSLVKAKYKDHIEFICELQENPIIKCWPAKLNQVFMNLLINGCHSIQTKLNKEDSHKKGYFYISSHIENNHLYIKFKDTGLGITEDNKKKIFDPFFTTKPVGNGTGLGLSLSYEIIEKHGGDILVDTVLGEGTTMTVSLPLSKEHH